jgi:hypothetical protein
MDVAAAAAAACDLWADNRASDPVPGAPQAPEKTGATPPGTGNQRTGDGKYLRGWQLLPLQYNAAMPGVALVFPAGSNRAAHA